MFETCTIFSRRSIMILFGLVAFVIGSLGVKVSGRDNPSITSMNRPMRDQRHLVLTVGQSEGDLQGKDDKVIQAGIDYLFRLGGGTCARGLMWSPDGFVGRADFAVGRAVEARVRLLDDAVELAYLFHGCRPALEEHAPWTALRPLVPFSAGYGLLEAGGR